MATSTGLFSASRTLLLGLAFVPAAALAANTYLQHNIISDIPGMADITDPGLVNPWGIATSPTGAFWFTDYGTSLSTLYSTAGNGSIPGTRVTINPGAANATARPTGIVFHTGAGFEVDAGHPAAFIFDGEDGTITAWAPATDATHALVKVDNSSSGAVYKGLAIGTSGGNTYLYAANFHSGMIEVYDSNFKLVTLAGAFKDPMVPAGFAPFNVWNIGGTLYVTYAKQDAAGKFDVSGPGNGYLATFDTSGNLIAHLISGAQLNSPWGVAIAPAGFGDYSGDLLVGNFGNGLINVFDPKTYAYIATLKDVKGNNIVIQGLWALVPGNGGSGGDAHAVYFVAGIGAGGPIQSHGLFGSLQAAPSVATTGVVNAASFQPAIAPSTFITIEGSNLSSTTRTWRASDFTDGNPPTTLDGVTVTINGKPAYPYYISPTQINAITPPDNTQGQVPLVVTNNGLTSAQTSVNLQAVAPAFFLFKGQFIAAEHADGSIIGATSLFPNSSTPAKPGETIMMFGTGFSTPIGVTAALPTVSIGGTFATVTYAGMISPGLYQINVTIPTSTPDGDALVFATFGSQMTPAASLTVQR